MKNLKCSSCGAELKIDENKEYAKCEHCGSKYKLKEDLNINIKLDDNVKDIINNGLGTAKHVSMFFIIPIALFIVAFSVIIILNIKSGIDSKKKQNEIRQESSQKQENFMGELEKNIFNLEFSSSAGTKNGIEVKSILDNVINKNKTSKRQIKVTYMDDSTIDEDKIIEIKHTFGDWDDYEISVNYDNDGYVNEIKIVKLYD